MELHLSRKIAEKRVFPAIDYNRSGTRKEELLTTQEELQKMWILRKIIHPMGEIDAMEFLINKLAMTKTNDDFFRDDEALITWSLPENATFLRGVFVLRFILASCHINWSSGYALQSNTMHNTHCLR